MLILSLFYASPQLYDTQMDDWTSQMKEILAEEEKAMNGTE